MKNSHFWLLVHHWVWCNMNYKEVKNKIEIFKSAELAKFAKNRRYNYKQMWFFFNIDKIKNNLKLLVHSCYASKRHEFKGQDLFDWFEHVLSNINSSWKTREALNNNRNLPSYSFAKTSHRKLFYKLCKQLKRVTIKFCDADDYVRTKLDYIQPMKHIRASRPIVGYIKDNLDQFIVNTWILMNYYSRNNLSMFIECLIVAI
jgi:hypothetical protein